MPDCSMSWEITTILPTLASPTSIDSMGTAVTLAVPVAPRIEPLVSLTLGLPQLAFLTPLNLLALTLAGALLGALGGWLARGGREA